MSIAKLTLELDELKEKRDKTEKEFDTANGRMRNGAIALLIGLVLFFITSGFISLIGAFLAAVGLLAALTNIGKKNKLERQLKEMDAAITAKRQEIAAATE